MTDNAEITSRVVAALESAAAAEAGANTALVSVNIQLLAPGSGGTIKTAVERKTRTLIFMRADLLDTTGAAIASASSVHKISA